MLVAVFGVFQVILILMHAATYQTLAAAFNINWPWLAWLFGILSVTFVSSSVLAHRFCNTFVRWYYRFSMYWFGLVIFLTQAAYLCFFLEVCLYHWDIYVASSILGTICFGGFFILHTYATWQTSRVKVSRFAATLPDGMSWPELWRGKKIIFVSDVHLGAARGVGLAKKVAAKIEAELPEAVFIGGDIFDGVKCHPVSLIEPLASLRPPQGIYFASGNHEYIEDTATMIADIKRMNIRVLKNEKVDLHGIQLVGVDWKDTKDRDDFGKALKDLHIDHTKPSILLRHEPSHLDIAEQAGISLTLCGHTHHGQIFPLRFITHKMYQGFDYGLKSLGKMKVYTSSGVGTWGPPLRLGTKAEIVAITFN
jgi:predicted MPP superfamily phosphohydrolase